MSRAAERWRWARYALQALPLLAIVVAPLLGGWQRLDHTVLAPWNSDGWNLTPGLRERLPLGERPAQAYAALELAGGGLAIDFFGVPAVDPTAGIAALFAARVTGRMVIALSIPLILGLIAGRFFCGWLCPFGWLSRQLSSLLRRQRLVRDVEIGPRRPLRYVLLAAAVLAMAFGVQWGILALLPHLLLQQSVYSAWLLGGGGAVLGALLGLVVACVALGPTNFCALLCPTGALLALLGRRRLLRVTLAEPSACGKHCGFCDSACWLQLEPRSGDPGPDCDACGRCFEVCPQINLVRVIGAKRLMRRSAASKLVALLIAGGLGASAAPAAAQREQVKPRLLMRAAEQVDGRQIAVEVVDHSGVKLGIDSLQRDRGASISVAVKAAGSAKIYEGWVEVELLRAGERLVFQRIPRPNHPRSAPRPAIYRMRTEAIPRADDQLRIRGQRFKVTLAVPRHRLGGGLRVMWSGLMMGAIYAGLLLLGIAVSRKGRDGHEH